MAHPLRLFPTEDETIEGTGRALRERRRTCRDVLDQCFAQIEEWEPKVHAGVVVDRDGAAQQARRLDEELAACEDRGPLHGIPLGIKDIIDVAGFPTGCGVQRWAQGPAEADAVLVAKLRAAGAVILGKTVTTPYAWVDPPITRNPWQLDRTPGGSSSGSAAAVACGMCLGTVGTQTGGSITRPASFCGIAGHKPHYLDVDSEGILPFAPSLDHPGPLARTVADLSLIDKVIRSHPWPERGPERPRSYAPLRRLASAERLEGPTQSAPRIGCLGGPFRDLAERPMRQAMDNAVDVFRASGAEVTSTTLPVEFDEVIAAHRTIMASEAAAFHEHRLAAMPEDYPPKIAALVAEGLTIPATHYVRAQETLWSTRRKITDLLQNFDVLIAPAALGEAPDPSTTGNPVFNSPWSLWGLPTITFPIGLSDAVLPLGIQLVGSDLRFKIRALFRTASWCEDAVRRAYEIRSH